MSATVVLAEIDRQPCGCIVSKRRTHEGEKFITVVVLMCDHHKLDAISLLAAALRDANDHWCDENWPYGPDRIGFPEKHAKAIEIAQNILK